MEKNGEAPDPDTPEFWREVYRYFSLGNPENPTPEALVAVELINATIPEGGIPADEGPCYVYRFFLENYLRHDLPEAWRAVYEGCARREPSAEVAMALFLAGQAYMVEHPDAKKVDQEWIAEWMSDKIAALVPEAGTSLSDEGDIVGDPGKN